MRPQQILQRRPDGTMPFTQQHPGSYEKPGTYFEQQHAKGLEAQRLETESVARLKAKAPADWTDADKAEFEALKWPSLKEAVMQHHNPPVPLPDTGAMIGFTTLVNTPKSDWTPEHQAYYESLTPADRALVDELNAKGEELENMAGEATRKPGPETNGAAVSQVMKPAPKPEKAPTPDATSYTAETLPEATPVMLDIINAAPVAKHPAMLEIIRTTSTPPVVRISQLKGLAKHDS